MSEPVLILGGYGVFGGKLARRLTAAGVDVIVAGRSLDRARAHCKFYGGRAYKLDRAGDLDACLQALAPAVVIDAAGPFQSYGDDPYRLARAAIRHGAHYLDLADDSGFVAGMTALDNEAKDAGVVVLSGASSVPAISSAALDLLTQGLSEIALVGATILPGNRAPRGQSVVDAIVAQAGRPIKFWRGGAWREAPAWGDLRRVKLAAPNGGGLPARFASRIDAPDRLLFPQRYGARSALFHAGLELRLMHVGLWLLGFLPRLGLMASLLPLSRRLKWMADRLESLGSDRGGMEVTAIGKTADEASVERKWTLIAEAGDGPEIPPTPAFLLTQKLLSAGRLKPGAGPAVGVMTLDEIMARLASFRIEAGITEQPAPVFFKQLLGRDYDRLPAPWRRLAEVQDIEEFAGVGTITRGKSLMSRLAGWIAGFPPAMVDAPVTVTKEKTAHGETWTRRFGDKTFRSHLSRKHADPPGRLRERFGPMRFIIDLAVTRDRVEWPVKGWTFLGLPMPAALAPRSESAEYVDADGRFRFDVAISLPLVGPVVHYQGWLKPAHDAPNSLAAAANEKAAPKGGQSRVASCENDQEPMPSNSTVDR